MAKKKHKSNLSSFMKAVEKSWVKDFGKYKKKLNKTQLKKLDQHMTKKMNSMNSFVKMFSAVKSFKPLKKNAPVLKHLATPYIMYTLLKMKRPAKPPSYNGSGGDPYTCGPEYFRSSCCCNHYSRWDNDRR